MVCAGYRHCTPLNLGHNPISMKTNTNPALVVSIIRDSGIIASDKPSVNYPIAVNLFYCNNSDGSVRWIWPKGNRVAGFSPIDRLCIALGLESVLSYGRLVLYTDVPTATYLQNQWRMN